MNWNGWRSKAHWDRGDATTMAVNSNDLSVDQMKINVRDTWEVRWWCNKLGCTEQQLKFAVQVAGTLAGNVKSYLSHGGTDPIRPPLLTPADSGSRHLNAAQPMITTRSTESGMTIKMTRRQLDVMLWELEAWMPKMLAETEEASQMDVFAGRAKMIEESAAEEDRPHVRDRLQGMLRDACLVPDENSPCDDEGA